MKFIYKRGHSKRYAHIPKRLRCLYPDEIRTDYAVYKREKNFCEIVETGGLNPILLAKDLPYTDGLYDG